ncbi:MAG TPA: tetratricopeptide repeat protein, partial [Fimbriimonas sp.]
SLVSEILARCPSVKVLGTSRQALGLPGEQVVRLASLPVPSAEEPFDSDTVARYDSVQLFDDRARMARPEFAITEHNAESVARLCRRLEGIPLAIELAAARVRAMPVDQVEARVADRFGFLKSQGRGRLPRQQTLRALIDWSYDLLADAERTLLRRLSVFSGGWTLRAAEQVCGTSGMIDEEEILDLLASLVDKSLIIFEEIEGRGRYRILDTVRQYAAARLAETEDLSPFRHRHADLYLQFLEERLAELHSRSRGEAIRLLREDLDNIVSALDWCERNEELSVRLIEVMHYAWPFFHASTSNRWRLGLLTRLLDLWADKLPEKCVTTGTYLRCLHLALAGEMDEAKEVLRRLWDSSEEPPYTLGRLNAMGYVHWLVGDVEGALRIFRHAEEEAGDNLELLGYSTQNQGSIALCQGRYLDARAYYERALEAHRRNGDTRAMIAVMSSLAKLAWLMDEREQALDWFVRYSRLERSWGYPAVQARQARDVARSIAECDPRHGAMLWGGARTMEEEEGPLADPTDGVGNEAFEAALRTRLGESDYADAVAEGARSLAWVRVRIHQALESLEHSRTQTPPADAPQTTGTA